MTDSHIDPKIRDNIARQGIDIDVFDFGRGGADCGTTTCPSCGCVADLHRCDNSVVMTCNNCTTEAAWMWRFERTEIGGAGSVHLTRATQRYVKQAEPEPAKGVVIEPATGKRWDILDHMQKQALQLICCIELEKSGVRDGEGTWTGSDPISGLLREIQNLNENDRRLSMYGDGPDSVKCLVCGHEEGSDIPF